ncbi:hypothetical protein PVT71_13830 [Salipiger sp. H15]|uniref:STAS/SEC14 domain-containing protein n=1 Tax=Alloyangia sp. H15 TaxID=3029062 RepID=A0AAU8AFM2_9RHOB
MVYLKFFGDTCIDECNRTVASLISDPEWRSGLGLLIDNSGITSYRGGFSKLQWLCAQIEESGAFDDCAAPVAYYSPSDLGFGVARMAQQVLSSRLPLEIHVFRDEAQALARLGQRETRLADLFAATA